MHTHRTSPASRTRRLICVAIVLALALAPSPRMARAAIDPSTWTTDGSVNAVLALDGTLYVGGRFQRIGPATGSGVPISTTTLQVVPHFPRVLGTVSAVAPDGAGGWYVSGTFTYVGGEARQNLAHITSAKTVGEWNPTTDGEVMALAVTPTDVVIGGDFNNVNGLARPKLARISRTTGLPAAWAPSPNERVTALASDGTTLYVAGWFGQVGITPRAGLAAFTLATDALTTWDPAATSTSSVQVHGLALGNGYIYVCGNFQTIGGQDRAGEAALRPGNASATAWAPVFFATTRLLPIGDRVILGSSYGLGPALAAVDSATGAQYPNWNPGPAAVPGTAPSGPLPILIHALEGMGSRVAVGGFFAGASGSPGYCFAVVDTTAGAAASSPPMPTREVRALARQGGELFVGGLFNSLGVHMRQNLASFDVVTGAPHAWAPDGFSPQPEPFGSWGGVTSLAADPTRVFAVVTFSDVYLSGQQRSIVRGIERANGASAWQIDSDQLVHALVHRAGLVYAGGGYAYLAGARTNLGALSAANGALQPWSPAPNGTVRALLALDDALVVGGDFTTIDGQPRTRLAQVDYVSAAPTAWNPGADASVRALARSGSSLYAGGDFANAGGQPRARVAALDLGSNTALAWDPGAGGAVHALATDGTNVFAGGDFLTFGGQPAVGFAGVPAAGGPPLAWGVSTNARVSSLALANNSHVYLGGWFSNLVTEPFQGLASIYDPGLLAAPPALRPSSIRLAVSPSPLRGAGDIHFTLERDVRVQLRVLDVTGRVVRTLLAGERRAAGPQRVAIDVAGLAPGVYQILLDHGTATSSGRFIVLR